MNQTFLTMLQQYIPRSPNGLTFTMDLAQLAVLAGLIWRLAEMSGAVKSLTKVTGELTIASKFVSDAMAALVTRVAVLEDRDNERRDRRQGDIHE